MTTRDLALVRFQNRLRGISMTPTSRAKVMELFESVYDAGAAAEREACLKIVEHVAGTESHELYQAQSVGRLIRARGEGE